MKTWKINSKNETEKLTHRLLFAKRNVPVRKIVIYRGENFYRTSTSNFMKFFIFAVLLYVGFETVLRELLVAFRKGLVQDYVVVKGEIKLSAIQVFSSYMRWKIIYP